MMYQAYQAFADLKTPLLMLAEMGAGMLNAPMNGASADPLMRNMAAASEIIMRSGLTHKRPPFALNSVLVGNREVEIIEKVVCKTPFCTLLHFEKQTETPQPPVLVVSPMSGHFATLLRDTVRTMLPDHDVYITDWHNVRDVPLSKGTFGIDEFVDHLIEFMTVIGPGCHVVAICQPSVPTLVAAAVMAEDGHPAQPRSMTLMAGPIDTRINPTKVNNFATEHPLDWFRTSLISHVPWRYGGAFRSVYPGFVQLIAFMSMNIDRHVKAFQDLYGQLSRGEFEKAEPARKFYDEYFAVMDLSADFFIETIRSVFQEHDLPRGEMRWHGRRVDPGKIKRTFLLTVEGERDDICSIGQTLAAQDLCTGIKPYMKKHYMQFGVGHYGVFSGRRWAAQTYPVVREMIHISQ